MLGTKRVKHQKLLQFMRPHPPIIEDEIVQCGGEEETTTTVPKLKRKLPNRGGANGKSTTVSTIVDRDVDCTEETCFHCATKTPINEVVRDIFDYISDNFTLDRLTTTIGETKLVVGFGGLLLDGGDDDGDNNEGESRKRWELARKKYQLNGSSMKAVMGLDYFKSVDSLVAERVLGHKPEFSAASLVHINRGRDLEPQALKYFKKHFGHDLLPLPSTLILSNTAVFGGKLGCTLDGLTWCGRVVEIKCPNPEKNLIPSYLRNHIHQVQAYMAVSMCKEAFFLQYVSQTNNHCQLVGVDAGWVEDATPAVQVFLDKCAMMRVDVDGDWDWEEEKEKEKEINE